MPHVEDIQFNEDLCMKFCGICPTYPGDNPGEALFCSRGESSNQKEKQGCNCMQCDVQKQYKCTGSYYCIEGPC